MYHILNISFIVAEADTASLRRALRRHVKPALAGVDAILLRLDSVQGQTRAIDEPASISLQCRFAEKGEMEAFRSQKLDSALESLRAETGGERCMIFETHLTQIGI